MSDRPPRARAPRPSRFLPGLLALAVAATGCSPGPGSAGSPATSKTPEVAKHQKHMEDMLKKTEAEAKPSGKSG
jgi:hypothetical protein